MAKPKLPRGGPSDVENCKVVLTGVDADADRYLLAKTIAGELAVTFEEARSMTEESPAEIFSSVPEAAAVLFADKIRAVGGLVEVVPLRLGPFSEAYPHKRARGKCKVTGAYICDQEILDAGRKLLSAEGMQIRRRRLMFRALAITALVATLAFTWLAIRPTVMRVYRHQTLDKGERVLIIAMANRMDKQRIDLFNDIGQDGRNYTGNTLWDVPTVFNREFSRYDASQSEYMTVDVRGVFETLKELPVPTDAGAGVGVHTFFRRMAERHKVDLDQFDRVVFIQLVPYAELPAGDEIRDLSIAAGSKAIVWFAADRPEDREHYLAAVMYALGRVLGGTDKLSARGDPRYPEGYPDASLAEFQSSQEAEIMAGYRPDQFQGRARVANVLQVRVSPMTAWEFGWISNEDRDTAYLRQRGRAAP